MTIIPIQHTEHWRILLKMTAMRKPSHLVVHLIFFGCSNSPLQIRQLRTLLSQLHPWCSWQSSKHLLQILQWSSSSQSPSLHGCWWKEGEGGAPSSWEKVQVLALLLSLVTRRREAQGRAGAQGIPPTAAGLPRFPLSEVSDFLFRNSWRLLAFLLTLEGLNFFFLTSSVATEVAFFFSLASREKEKPEPTLREKEKAIPWLASAWQKSMHLMAKVESSPFEGADADIVASYFWTMKSNLRTSWIDMLPLFMCVLNVESVSAWYIWHRQQN